MILGVTLHPPEPPPGTDSHPGDQLLSVILYGSQARGKARARSDIDVLIVVRDDTNYRELVRRTVAVIADVSLKYDMVISEVFVSGEHFEKERTPSLHNVRREAVSRLGE